MAAPQGPKAPAYVIPSTEIGIVIYREKEAVGLQFVDPNGEQIFVSLPGKILPHLGQSIVDACSNNPELLGWLPSPLPQRH